MQETKVMLIMLRRVWFSVTYVNAYTGVVMLRFRKAHYQLLWSALPFITSIWNQGQKLPCFFNCIHVGGKRTSMWRHGEHTNWAPWVFQAALIRQFRCFQYCICH